ncbi:MAG: hypothetical protein K6U74_04880 [Firmicutes bacterium]|nr:hypothetical protein [Bacillota bacterium]
MEKEAAYLLRHFPVLWEQACLMAENALEGGSHGDLTGTGRHPTGSHGDPTARRALALVQARSLKSKLKLIEQWINTRLPPEDRPLLLAIWRYGWLGWPAVARELGRGAGECRRRWAVMVKGLTNWLTSAP